MQGKRIICSKCALPGILIILLLGVWTAEGSAAFPEKPIKAVICYEAGSATDIGGRQFYKYMEKELGQPIMVVNKPGAASSLGLREVCDSKPDGYTWGLSCSVNVLKMMGLLPYDHHDFHMISVASLTWSALVVSAKSPFKTVKELVDYAKANPGKLRLSTTSKGAVFYIQAKYFERVTGTKFNLIANPGGATFIATQVGGGHADVGISSYKPLQSQIEAKNIRVLGITADKRVSGFESLPTLKEQGYDIVVSAWSAGLAPKGLPQEVSHKIVSAAKKVAESREWRDYCVLSGAVPTPEYVGDGIMKFLDRDADIQRPILEEIGMLKKK